MTTPWNTRSEYIGSEWVIDGTLGDAVSAADSLLQIEWRLLDNRATTRILLTKADSQISIIDIPTKKFRIRVPVAAQEAAGLKEDVYEDEVWYARVGDTDGRVFSRGTIEAVYSLRYRSEVDGTLYITIGQLWSAEVTIRDQNGVPIPLTGGRTVSAIVFWDDGQEVATVTVLDAAGGVVQLSLDDSDTANIPEGDESYLQLDLLDSDGDVEIRERIPVRGE